MTRKLLALSVAAGALSLGVAHAQTINGGGSSLAFPTYASTYDAFTNANPNTLFSFEAVGSGAGQKAFFSNDIDFFLPQGNPSTNGYATGTGTYGSIVGTTVDFGASDAFLTAGQYGLNSVGGYAYTTAVDSASASSSLDGPVIQIPSFGTPIAIAYNPPTYNAGTMTKPKIKQDFTKLTLTDATICGIFSGQITDWHQVTTLPAGAPTSAPILVAYRSDSSGTSFLLTNHFYNSGLGDVCNSGNDDGNGAGFVNLTGPTKTFNALFAATGNSAAPYAVPGNFVGASGSPNLQEVILGTYVPPGGNTAVGGPGSIGYISPDYTSAIKSGHGFYNKAVLTAFVVNNINNKPYQPTEANAYLGLEHPASNSQVLVPPTGKTNSENPLNWVPNVPNTTEGYPIVGYTTLDFSQCYADTTVSNSLVSYLNAFFGTADQATIKANGFTPLPAAFLTAIKADFIGNTSTYNLNIGNTTACAGLGR
jgi:ABC-type phosphate transport system substrate-binding protein